MSKSKGIFLVFIIVTYFFGLMTLTGFILPALISSDKLQMPTILLILSIVAFLVGSIFLITLDKFTFWSRLDDRLNKSSTALY